MLLSSNLTPILFSYLPADEELLWELIFKKGSGIYFPPCLPSQKEQGDLRREAMNEPPPLVSIEPIAENNSTIEQNGGGCKVSGASYPRQICFLSFLIK